MRRWVVFWLMAGWIFNVLACAPDPAKPLPVGPTGGWEVLRPLPVGYNLHDIWGQDSANVWAVGSVGTIVHWDGETIRQADSPTHFMLEAIDGWAADNIYAGGHGDLIHYDGRTWELDYQFSNEYIRNIYCAADGRLYVSGSMGLVFRDGSGWHSFDGPRGFSDSIWLGPDGLIRVSDSNYLWLIENDLAVLELDFGEDEIQYADGHYLVVETPEDVDRFYHFVARGNWQWEGGVAYSVRTVLDLGNFVYADNSGIHYNSSSVWPNDSGRWIYNLAHCGDGSLLACGHGGTLLFAEISSDGLQFHDPSDGVGYRAINVFAGNRCDNIWAGEWWGRVLHFDGEIWTKESSGLSYAEAVTRLQVLSDDWVVASSGQRVSLRDPDQGRWTPLPDLPHDIYNFRALAHDSIMVAARDLFHLWNGESWSPVGSIPRGVGGMAVTPSGLLYAAAAGPSQSSLLKWDGSAFVLELDFPGFNVSVMCASRESETLWFGGYYNDDLYNTAVFRYRAGVLEEVSTGVQLPPNIAALTEWNTDDLFLLAQNQIWRFHQGIWSRDHGLPAGELYQTIWSLPGCGVFAQGHPTFFNDFSEE